MNDELQKEADCGPVAFGKECMVKIYIISDPRTCEVRYVGKTVKTLEKRLSQHLKGALKCGSMPKYSSCWMKGLLGIGVTPVIDLIEEVRDDEWQEAERFWKKTLESLGCRLTNMTDGGEGFHNPCEATRKRLSIALTGKVHTQEWIENQRKFMQGKQYAKGKTWKLSDETKRRMSESGTGRVFSEEACKNISQGKRESLKSKLKTLFNMIDGCDNLRWLVDAFRKHCPESCPKEVSIAQ